MQLLLQPNVKKKLLITLLMAKYKCPTLGWGKRTGMSKPHQAVIHPFIYLLCLLFSVPDLHPHGEQSDAEAQD